MILSKSEKSILTILIIGATCILIFHTALGLYTHRGYLPDFSNFYVAGQKAFFGQEQDLFNNSALVNGAKPLGKMAFASTPLSAYLYSPLAYFEPFTALAIFKAAGTLCLWTGLALIYRHLSGFTHDPIHRKRFLAVILVSAVFFQPFWTIYFVGGQSTPLVFLALVSVMILRTKGFSLVPALLFVFACSIKPVLAPGFILLLVFDDTRFRLHLIIVTAVAIILSLILFGLDLHLVLLNHLFNSTNAVRPPYFNSNLFTVVEAWLTPVQDYFQIASIAPVNKAISLSLRLALVTALIWVYRPILVIGDRPGARSYFLVNLGVVVSLVLSPIVWAHYLSWLYVILIFVFAFPKVFPPTARILAGTAIVSSFFQHIWLIQTYDSVMSFDTKAEFIAVAVLKGIPMALTVTLLLGFSRHFKEAISGTNFDVKAARTN